MRAAAISAVVALTACIHHAADRFNSQSLLAHGLGYLRTIAHDQPTWQRPGELAFADDMRPAGADAILVGWQLQVATPPFFKIAPRDYTLIDRASGATRWSIPRGPQDALVVTAPDVIILTGGPHQQLVAHDLASGQVVYTHPVGDQPVIVPVGTGILVASMGQLESIDGASGKTRWSVRDLGTVPPTLTPSGDQVIVRAADHACIYALDSGKRGTCFAGLAPPIDGAEPVHLGSSWLFQGADVVAFDAAGTMKWRTHVPDTDQAIAGNAELLVVREKEPKVRRLRAIRVADGKDLWRTENLGDEYASAPLVLGDRVYVTTAREAWMFDAKTGATIRHERFGSSTWPRLADKILVDDHRAVFIAETSLIALDKESGDKDWSLAPRGTVGGSYRIARDHYRNVGGETGGADELAHRQRALDHAMEKLSVDLQTINTQLNAPGGLNSLHGSQATDATVASVGVSASVIGFNVMNEMAAAMYAQSAKAASFSFASAKLAHVVALHAASVQGHFFVRPMEWLWGQGLIVVDLRTGEWREPRHRSGGELQQPHPDSLPARVRRGRRQRDHGGHRPRRACVAAGHPVLRLRDRDPVAHGVCRGHRRVSRRVRGQDRGRAGYVRHHPDREVRTTRRCARRAMRR